MCKKVYVDNNTIEPALLDSNDFKKFSWGSIAMILMGVCSLYFVITAFNMVALIVTIFCLSIGVASLVSSLKYNPETDESLQIAIKESKERVLDPNYVIALWKAGCYITPSILKWAKSAMEEEQSLRQ